MHARVFDLQDVSVSFRRNAIEACSLKYALGSWLRGQPRPAFAALSGVSLSIAPGERLGIIGRNGAGKSTLLRVLARVITPQRGRVAVDPARRIVPLLELGVGFHPDLSGAENCRLAGALLGLPRAAVDARLDGIVRFAGIDGFVHEPVKHLSSGMAITHVVRGDDHVSNTPKQVLLYEAFGRPVPLFAHVPLILGPDKKRLSKRHGATSVMEYHRLGYLPEAMVNFLALLGWSPGGDREILSRDELISLFTLEGISGGNAVFNPEKLDWFNQQHIGRLTGAALLARLEPRLREAGLWRASFTGAEGAWIVAVLDLLKPRVKKLDQLVDELRPFLVEEPEFDQGAVGKHLTAAIQPVLARFADAVERQKPGDPAAVEQLLRGTAEQAGVKAAALIHGTRVAVTGRAVSAGLFEVLSLLGVERTVQRLRRAVSYPPTP